MCPFLDTKGHTKNSLWNGYEDEVCFWHCPYIEKFMKRDNNCISCDYGTNICMKNDNVNSLHCVHFRAYTL